MDTIDLAQLKRRLILAVSLSVLGVACSITGIILVLIG